MTDLDRDETRALALTLVHQLNPSLSGEQVQSAAANLMRLAARMAGHVAAEVAERNYNNDPESDGSADRMAAVGRAFESTAVDTGETLAEEQPCPGCGAVGGHYGSCSLIFHLPCGGRCCA